MAFVNEYISPEDRERYQLAEFEKQFFTINPQDDWAIDREQNIFLRVIRPATRGSEPGDPDARFEKDFHFHWKGYDYLVSTSRKDQKELDAIPCDVFSSDNPNPEGARVLRFYLLHVGEMGKPTPDSPSALRTQRQQLLSFGACFSLRRGRCFCRLNQRANRRAPIRYDQNRTTSRGGSMNSLTLQQALNQLSSYPCKGIAKTDLLKWTPEQQFKAVAA